MVSDMSIIKLLASASICLVLAGGENDVLQFGVNGKAILCVPRTELHEELIRFMDVSIDLKVGSGHAPGFLFFFKPRYMEQTFDNYYINSVSPYANVTDAFRGSVGFTAPEDRIRWGPAMRARNISEIWYRQKPCSEPSVEAVIGSEFYRVKCNSGDRSSSLWARTPGTNEKMPDPDSFVAATCQYDYMQYGPFKDYTLKNCMRTIILDEFVINYDFQEENSRLIKEFDHFIINKIHQWRGLCYKNI